jgi:hypothetical protein
MKKRKLTSKQVKEDIVASLEDCKLTREEIIEKLINEDVEDIYRNGGKGDVFLNDINDFEWLCRKCHMEKDGRIDKFQWHKLNLPWRGIKK